jgi:alpha-D-xyloside xylohydrolase
MPAEFFPVRRAKRVQSLRDGLRFCCETTGGHEVSVTITVWTANVVRVRMSKNPTEVPASHNLLVGVPDRQCRWESSVDADRACLTTADFSVVASLDPWQLSFVARDGQMITREAQDDSNVAGLAWTRSIGYSCEDVDGPGCIRYHENLLIHPGEHFYGTGERFTPLDKLQQNLSIWNADALGVRTQQSYKNVPLFLSSRGYGVFVHDTTRIGLDFGATSGHALAIEVPGSSLDYFFLYGPTLTRILESYTGLTGRAPVPPKWSFGVWASTCFTEATEQSVMAQCRLIRERKIPVSVYHFDCHWLRAGHWNDFQWDTAAFPNPERLIASLHEQGFKVSIWENPYVAVDTDLYREGAAKGFFATHADGSVYLVDEWSGEQPLTAIVDFTNPAATAWYKDLHRPLFRMGVDVFKTDFGEGIPADAHFSNGHTGLELHNAYPLLYNGAVFEVTVEETGHGLVWGRAGYAGSQRYPTCWSGDPHTTFEDMALVLRGGLSLALSGVAFWSHDIGGFAGPTPSAELYTRWAQFGLLSSHSRYHGMTLRDPWLFGTEAERVFGMFAGLRCRLIPYLYSYAHVAAQTGIPVIRPLVLEYCDDPVASLIDQEYFLGEALLISPVVAAGGAVTTYLPAGEWFDFWSGERMHGPRWLQAVVALDMLPIYVKAGSIVPLGSDSLDVLTNSTSSLTLNVYPAGGSAHGRLHDDQGVVEFHAEPLAAGALRLSASAAGSYAWRVASSAPLTSVQADGRQLPLCTAEDFATAIEGCIVTPTSTQVKVRMAREVVLYSAPSGE